MNLMHDYTTNNTIEQQFSCAIAARQFHAKALKDND